MNLVTHQLKKSPAIVLFIIWLTNPLVLEPYFLSSGHTTLLLDLSILIVLLDRLLHFVHIYTSDKISYQLLAQKLIK